MDDIDLRAFNDELTKIAREESSTLLKALIKIVAPKGKSVPVAERAVRRQAKRKLRSMGRRGRAKLREAVGEA